MKEIILCKYGEIVLKGSNKSRFESLLLRELKYRAKKFGNFKIYFMQSTVYIEPLDDMCDIDGMLDTTLKVFGLAAVTRAAECEKNMDAIIKIAEEYVPQFFVGNESFKVEAKRADKAFPLTSPEISAEVGGAILSALPTLRVDVKNPMRTIKVEVRESCAYIHAEQKQGAGGLPVGSSGKGLLLLSGGIDSPVAGYMMAKRGVSVDAVHFESFPYTSERAREKVIELASIMAEWCGRINLHIISLTHIQEEIVKNCAEDYFTLLLRRYMMSLALRVAKKNDCLALITGESLGQVASQTTEAICVTDLMSDIPVFRPCIGLDKEEIVKIARKIGSFETSILPYEDCCTVFTPKHPKTRPELAKVIEQEQKLDFEKLCDEAFATLNTISVCAK